MLKENQDLTAENDRLKREVSNYEQGYALKEQQCLSLRELHDNAVAENDRLRAALKSIAGFLGNVDHSRGNGPNSAKARGDMLNGIRDIAKQALEG